MQNNISLTQVSPIELRAIIKEVVSDAMVNIKSQKAQPFIKGIHELAKFLRVSPARAQQLKNEGAFPYWQDGRTVLFDPEKVREAMNQVSKGA